MKTSNKILLSTLLVALLILLSVHVAIYAKYKKGDFVLVGDEMWPNMITQSFQNIKYVSVSNLQNVTLHAGDTTKLAYSKAEDRDSVIRYLQKGDTLFLSGKAADPYGRNWNAPLRLYLSKGGLLNASHAGLILNGEALASAPSSWNFQLDNTELIFQNKESNARAYFDSVFVDAKNDSKLVLRNANFKKLYTTLLRSSMDESSAIIEQFSIKADADSKIALRAENILKAKLSSNE